jgi:membrane protein
VFAMIYKLMPRVHVRWHDVWLGAIVTSLLFTFGKFLIGLYIGKSGVASGFGAAGSLIVVFIWVYYSAQIFLLGAEFTWVYAKTLGSLRSEQGVAEVVQKAARADDVPSRGDAPQQPQPQPQQPQARGAERGSASTPAAPAAAKLADVGAGLAFFVALRFVIPRLLRRL